MFQNAKLRIFDLDQDGNPLPDPEWVGFGWTAGYKFGFDRKESGDMENFEMSVRVMEKMPLRSLSPGQRVEVDYDDEIALFNLARIDRVHGGLTILRLDTFPGN